MLFSLSSDFFGARSLIARLHPDFSSPGVSTLGICFPHDFGIYKNLQCGKQDPQPRGSPSAQPLCSPINQTPEILKKGRNRSTSLAPAFVESAAAVRKRQDSSLGARRGASSRRESFGRG